MTAKHKNKRSYENYIDDDIKDLVERCNKSEPLARYADNKVFKCFVREYMQLCHCNELCLLNYFHNVDLNNLCDEWDTESIFNDDRYLRCNVPVIVNDLLYKKITYEDLKYEKTFYKIPYEKINDKYRFEVKNFVESCQKKDAINTRRYFDTMRCAVFDIREYCRGKESCEWDFFRDSLFDKNCIPKLYLNKFVLVSSSGNTTKLMWRFTSEIAKLYISKFVEEFDILNIPEFPVQEVEPDDNFYNKTMTIYPNNSFDSTPKTKDITTESPITTFLPTKSNPCNHFTTTTTLVPKIDEYTTAKPIYINIIKDSNLFNISLGILVLIGIIINYILALSSHGSKISKLLVCLICIILFGMIVLGIERFYT